MTNKGKCITPVSHPDSGDLVEAGEIIEVADKAQFDSLVEIGAVSPEGTTKKAAAAPAIPAAA